LKSNKVVTFADRRSACPLLFLLASNPNQEARLDLFLDVKRCGVDNEVAPIPFILSPARQAADQDHGCAVSVESVRSTSACRGWKVRLPLKLIGSASFVIGTDIDTAVS